MIYLFLTKQYTEKMIKNNVTENNDSVIIL